MRKLEKGYEITCLAGYEVKDTDAEMKAAGKWCGMPLGYELYDKDGSFIKFGTMINVCS